MIQIIFIGLTAGWNFVIGSRKMRSSYVCELFLYENLVPGYYLNKHHECKVLLSEGVIKMSRNDEELKGITLLGNQNTKYAYSYAPEILESFDNKHIENDYWVKFNCPEFTTLCPITGQPDFATIYIKYIPNVKMVESKSLKLYLLSFRNHGDFHEDVVNIIMKDLTKLMQPRYIEVWGKFLPRGGISIDPYCNYGKLDTKYEKLAWYRMQEHDLHSLDKVDNR